jgi:hypothetical protein
MSIDPTTGDSQEHDPVFQGVHIEGEDDYNIEIGKWYFYDETWSDVGGPYDTEEQARAELARYVAEVLG